MHYDLQTSVCCQAAPLQFHFRKTKMSIMSCNYLDIIKISGHLYDEGN
jgi:hypothetical protein